MTAAERPRPIYAGFDIGGTATRAILWQDGRCLGSRSLPTASFAAVDVDARVRRLAAMVLEPLPSGTTLAAVGIGASGPIDVERGVIQNIHTLPALSGFPIVAALGGALHCPVVIESDAVVAAVAEHRLGAGRQATRMLMVTLGTGIGVTLLIDGLPFRGSGGAHPEGGHIPIVSGGGRCYCGATGCWEQQASRGALEARLAPVMPAGMRQERIIDEAAQLASSSAAVRRAFRAYGRLVGRGLATLHTLYMPEVTVLGGSAARHLDHFGRGLARALERTPDFAVSSIVRAATLDEAGAIGAALLAGELAR